MIIDISVAVIALACVLIATYLCMTLATLRKTLRRINRILRWIQGDSRSSTPDLVNLLVSGFHLIKHAIKRGKQKHQ